MHEVKMPQLGQSVEEASIVKWYKNEGDRVKMGEPIFSIQTDKAEIECESTAAGILRKILLDTDVMVPVLTVVALVGEADEPLPNLAGYGGAAPAPTAAKAAAPEPAPASVSLAAAPQATAASGRKGVSPRARSRAKRLGIDPALAAGSGAEQRVMEADVIAYAEVRKDIRITPTARRVAELEGVDIAQVRGTGPRGKVMKADIAGAAQRPQPQMAAGQIRRVPLSPMRRIIAKRMAESKFSAPHYYVTVEVDMSQAVQFRAAQAPNKPSFNDLVVLATARAILQWPGVNARWAGDAIEEVGDINLGIAVALPSGLIVPVLRQVQTKSLQDIARESRELAEKARSGKLAPDDYSGNTFTISNLGAFGVDQFTAIINQPDSAILAVGQIKDRPVVIDGGIHIRPIVKLTLSSDHRVIDGAVAAQFMGCLKETLETADFA